MLQLRKIVIGCVVMISTVFLVVAILMTPIGPQAVTINKVYETKEACEVGRAEANLKSPVTVIVSKCIAIGLEA